MRNLFRKTPHIRSGSDQLTGFYWTGPGTSSPIFPKMGREGRKSPVPRNSQMKDMGKLAELLTLVEQGGEVLYINDNR